MQMTLSQAMIAGAFLFMQVSILALMVKRGQRSVFPIFFNYLVFSTVAVSLSVLAFLFIHVQYFYIYWSMSTLVMLFGFAVMYEVFVNILKPFSAVIDLGKMLFLWAGLFLLLAAFLTAVVTNGSQPNKLVVAVDLCDRCVHLMQCGMLMLLIFFEKRLNLSWRSHAMCIAIGMGAAAAIDLTVSYGQTRFPELTQRLDMFNSVAFVSILAFWAFRLMAKQPARKTAADSPTRLILQRWNEALVGYGYGDVAFASNAGDSFLPGVEKTVDRVLARKIVR